MSGAVLSDGDEKIKYCHWERFEVYCSTLKVQPPVCEGQQQRFKAAVFQKVHSSIACGFPKSPSTTLHHTL
jgi:hypothetical protein